MKIAPKQLRVLFVDDEDLEIVKSLLHEGYDVVHWRDVDNLERLCDGTYHVIFLDVRGVGERNGGSGLDILKYVSVHNPLIYAAVFSAKPFTGAEAEIIRKYARRSITKDCTVYEIIEILEEHAASLNDKNLIGSLEERMSLTWWQKWKIRRGTSLTPREVEKIAKTSSIGADAIKIASNMTTIVVSLIKLLHGGDA